MELFNRVRELVAEHSGKEIGFKAISASETTPLAESCFDVAPEEDAPTTYQVMFGDIELPYTFEYSSKTLDALSGMGVDPIEGMASAISHAILCLIEPKKFMEPEEKVMGFGDIMQTIDGTSSATALRVRILRLRETLMALQNTMSMEAYIMSHDLTGDFVKKLELLSKDNEMGVDFVVESMRSYILEIVFKVLEEVPVLEETPPVENTLDSIDGEEKNKLNEALSEFTTAMRLKLFEKVEEGWGGWDDPKFYAGGEDCPFNKTFYERLALAYSKFLDEVGKPDPYKGNLSRLFVKLANFCLFGYYHNQI